MFKCMRSFNIAIAAAYAALALSAQTPSASLLGRVCDDSGAPVATARVEVISVETNETESYTTGNDGNFSALQLPVGTYRVVIAKDGFRTLEQPKVELQLDETA